MALQNLDRPELDVEDKKQGTARVWAFIVWEESAPSNFIDIIRSYHIPALISPFHNKDKQSNGEPKKPHWHVMLNYSGKQSYEQIKTISDSVNGSFPIRVKCIFGMTRYFTHMDDPDKFQYSISDLISIAGYDIDYYIKPQTSAIEKSCKLIDKYISTHNVLEFDDLIEYALENDDLWYYILKNIHTNYYYKRLQSRRNKLKEIDKHYKKIDEVYYEAD